MCVVCVCVKGVDVLITAEEEERAYFLKTRSARRHKSRINKRKNTRGQDKVCSLPSRTDSMIKALSLPSLAGDLKGPSETTGAEEKGYSCQIFRQ